ncbi:uncharacterized protein LOC106942060, partial [Poecilia latipinna]|uniref:uncharacterized protein LOC106942060 n=1 Tax=Poecilia latipinna TaxID=48699 RepID=UPI00072EC727
METVSPSDLSDVHPGIETKPVEPQRKPAVLRTKRGRQQVEAKAAKMPVCDVLPSESQEMSNCPGLLSSPPSQLTLERSDSQRTQKSSKGKSDLLCRCSEGLQSALVPGTYFGSNRSTSGAPMSCSIVAAIKHHISPICTWKTSDVDEVSVQGCKLAEYIARERLSRGSKPELCKLVQNQTIFGQNWKVRIVHMVQRKFDFDQEGELYEFLQMYLRDGMCIFRLHEATTLVVHHGEYFAVVDFGTRNSEGLASESGTPVVVFNTSLFDLMVHLNKLRESLNATEYAIHAISVKEMCSNDTSGALNEDTHSTNSCHASSSHVASFSGSFHQGADRFEYGGLQCAPISLVALTKHTLNSIFSWNADTLDNVVVLGDELYTSLHDSNLISGGHELLSIPDLPKNIHVDGQHFECLYGECVSGDVDILGGELIEKGVLTTLWDGLNKMCGKYETCFITLCGSTCALISVNGCYVIVDSHARNNEGMVDANGRSVVLYFNCIDELFAYLTRISAELSVTRRLFEINGVDIVQMESSKSASEHSAAVPSSSGLFGQSSCDMQDNSYGGHSVQLEPTNRDDGADVVVTDVQNNKLYFNPISEDIARSLCGKLNVELERANCVSSVVGELGVPCMTETIVGDGNCFFRSLSQAISGNQKSHRKIRLVVVNQLQKKFHMYTSILRNEYSSMSEYIRISRMQYVGSWATEVEIQAAADFFGVNIFTYCNDKWLKYISANTFSNHGLYLQNIDGNHYETVVCVKQPKSQTCYGYCTNEDVSGKRKTRQKTIDQKVARVEMVKIENSVQDECVDNQNAFLFTPLSRVTAKTLCNNLKIDFEEYNFQYSTLHGPLGSVCKIEIIIHDNNSFFRAVAHVLSGSQNNHRKIRLAVVSYMAKNIGECEELLERDYTSVMEYVNKSQMKYLGHCATEIEFKSAANMLGLDICVFNGTQWTKYSSNNSNLTHESLCLQNCNNHFDVVVCAKKGHEDSCFKLCNASGSLQTQYMHTRSLQVQENAKQILRSNKTNYCFSKYFKRKRN